MTEDATLRMGDSWTGPRSEGPGSRIGPYLLTRRIGEGGFGVVFEAEQEQPVRRRVALKILKLGMDTHEVIARFDAERQALAMMEHRHIASVFDAGATEGGRPYFVMEFVEGVPIAQYCDENQMDLRGRLELFDQVCAAVQHAHTKGVIHRDLKPGNVLVSTQDGKPLTKVIDFGIAKATRGNLTEKTLATGLNQVIGTLQYMSPEQAEGSPDIDTRSDIYSLGIILYELLAGSTPIEAASLRAAAFSEVQRMIREDEPPRPSVRLAQDPISLRRIAARRGSEPRKLARSVGGELDWIVMKAIEKDRLRRYETANGLAMDVRRYLAAEPVLAAPPSASYRLQKFVRRHKGTVAAGSAVALALFVGVIAFAWQARKTEARAAELERVAAFQSNMLEQLDPAKASEQLSSDVLKGYESAIANLAVPESEKDALRTAFASAWRYVNATDIAVGVVDTALLSPSLAEIDERFADQPVLAASLRSSIGDRYNGLGLFEKAAAVHRDVYSRRKALLGETHPATLQSLNFLGVSLNNLGRQSESLPLHRKVFAARAATLGPNHPETLDSATNVALSLDWLGQKQEAAAIYADVSARWRKHFGEAHPSTVKAQLYEGNNLVLLGRLDEAEAVLMQAYESAQKHLSELDPIRINASQNLAALWMQRGDWSRAEAFNAESLALRRRASGNLNLETLYAMNDLATVWQRQKRYAEAETLFRELNRATEQTLPDTHSFRINAQNNLGRVLQYQGKFDEAAPLIRSANAAYRASLGDTHLFTLISTVNVGAIELDLGNRQAMTSIYAELEPKLREQLKGPDRGVLAKMLQVKARSLSDPGQRMQRANIMEESCTIWIEARGVEHDDAQACIRELLSWLEGTTDPSAQSKTRIETWRSRLR